MKLANVDGQRQGAQPGLLGECPVCGATTIAKCGEKNIWHWAHKGKRNCDRWWESETEWHRNWKNQFPIDWQEVVQQADDGERHIADVKTEQGWVIEFQHSHIKPDERRSREAFYGTMVWVIDGLRRRYDFKQFTETLHYLSRAQGEPLVAMADTILCRLVKEWFTSRVPVIFDFGEESTQGLWLLFPLGLDHKAYVAPVDRDRFISRHREGLFNPQPFIDFAKAREARHVRAMRRAYFEFQRAPYSTRKRPRRRF